MRHTMKLKEDPFERMKNGTKTIEFRLYDEKEGRLKLGMKLNFLNYLNCKKEFWLELKIYIEEILLKICLK